MKVAFLAFTEKGLTLAERLAKALDGSADRCGDPLGLQQWTELHFYKDRALVYIGAVGIAVRAIAPYLHNKTTDPAVVALDECAHFAVPLLSGHLGGANALARRLAELSGAVPVITTATDANNIFAVDEWAKRQHCAVLHPSCIRKVSGALLAGKNVQVKSEVPVEGNPPQGMVLTDTDSYQVYVGVRPQPESVLWLVPQNIVLGVGCRKGTTAEMLENAFSMYGLPPQAICGVASIDLKAKEAGLLEFCQHHGWPFCTYDAEKLAEVEGTFSGSAFVEKTVGVDNVCERAAVLCSKGALMKRKETFPGITLAAAAKPFRMDWSFYNEW